MYWSVKVWFCSLVTLVAVSFANVTPPPYPPTPSPSRHQLSPSSTPVTSDNTGDVFSQFTPSSSPSPSSSPPSSSRHQLIPSSSPVSDNTGDVFPKTPKPAQKKKHLSRDIGGLLTPEKWQKSPGGTTAITPGGGHGFVQAVHTESEKARVVWNQESEERDTLEVANEKDKKAAKKKSNAKRKDKDGGRSQEFVGRSSPYHRKLHGQFA